METSLLTTKLFIPPARPGLVARPRLMERLRDALSCSLVLVSAPAGFGKSTLLGEWARQNKEQRHTAWLSLDEGDNDPVRFWDYFIAALKTIRPAAGETALTYLHAVQPYPPESVLTALINDLTDIPDDFAVVLDDYHLIKAEQIHAGINFLLDHLPPKMHLVIATRVDPALPLAQLRGRGIMLEIGADDLRFTLEEATALLREMLNLELTEKDISTLNDQTEGWAVGLKMAGLSMRGQKDVEKFIAAFTGSQRFIMDYLVEQVLMQQPEEVRSFLLKTSVLERLNKPLCACLAGNGGRQEMLVDLENSLEGFLIPLDESRQWYRYHHLFSDLLRHQLETNYGAKEVTQLHQLSSRWYEDNKLPDDAIHHALAARDWERATTLIAKVAEDRIKRGEMMTLLGWLQAVPDEVLRTNLILYRQYSHILVQTGQLEAGEAALRNLEKAAPDNAELQGEVAYEQADIARRRGDIPYSIELARRALSYLALDSLVLRVRASYILGMNLYEIGLYDEAWSVFTDTYEQGRQTADYLSATDSLAYLAFILMWKGQLQRAAQLIQKAIDLAGHSPAGAMALQRMGQVLYEWNDLDTAAYYQQLSVELTQLRGQPENYVAYCTFLARTRQAQGDSKAALEALAKADKMVEQRAIRPGILAWNIAFHGLLALRQNDLPAALKWSVRLSEYSDVISFSQRHILPRLLIARGERTSAMKRLQDYYLKAVQVDAQGLMIQTRVYQSLAAATLDEALTFLSEALVKGELEGFIRTFVDEGKLLAPLLRKALAQGVTPEYTAKLLNIIETEERQRQARNGGIASSSASPGLLSERELEILRLVAVGLSNRQIAERLIISLATAKTHVHNISVKLNAKTRTQAISRARELKLL